ncbi:sensor histidine kinase [Mahella australiensis]|uniref:histidine kinase n=1 Tax=Mahella australiensis (strain DSM 15567 / CIP 107919 / 50-1 BON) TaxID=697281 RepID=F4A336_MAHA5|nr:sensor histidine kinase [Mahella australiensis]AEE96269.1 integral membrane sensor signal transduction histidine kinase [Mahella australiensis 50-1 BON]
MIKTAFERFRDLSISKKIVLYYLFVFILSTSFLSIVYKEVNNSITNSKVMQISNEITLNINSNITSLINLVDNQSKILISSELVQDALSSSNKGNSAVYVQSLSKYLANFLNFNDFISSIYIFDNNGNKYFVDNVYFNSIDFNKIKSMNWYEQLVDLKGGYILKLDAGKLLEPSNDQPNYVSFVRIINNIDTQEPSGMMIINISKAYLSNYVNSALNAYTSSVLIKDENGADVINSANIDANLSKTITNYIKPNSASIQKINGQVYIISDLKNDYGWNIISVTPFNELNSQFWVYNMTLLIVIIINAVLIILGLLFISLYITQPITKLAHSMSNIKDGHFEEVNVITGNDEIGMLKDVYNKMIIEIQNLIGDIINEQKMKRNLELEVMQAQIKPHFLFNSFDAINSLILMDDTENASKIVRALGKFYKSFLMSGDEEITIKEELDMIDNYLTIQNIRFEDKFDVIKNIDEQTLDYKIPKLILQPLVENAINHGIRPKRGKGLLTIEAKLEGDHVILAVEDNGKGMSDAKIRDIAEGKFSGVGLKSTIERLRLHYNADNIVKIYSKPGKGTRIEITIHIIEENQDV